MTRSLFVLTGGVGVLAITAGLLGWQTDSLARQNVKPLITEMKSAIVAWRSVWKPPTA